MKEQEQRNGFFEDIANVTDWFWRNYEDKNYRKKVSHLGGHLTDFTVGESCKRGGFKIRAGGYRVADNKYYRMLWEEWKREIVQSLANVRATASYEGVTNYFSSDNSIGDILECCSTYWWLNNKPH